MPIRHLGRLGGRLDGSTRPKSAAAPQPPARLGNSHPSIVPYQSFPTADGDMILAVGNDSQFAAFCQVAGHAEWSTHPSFQTNAARVQNRAMLVPLLRQTTVHRSTAEWIALLEQAGVPCGPINDLAQVFADPQVQARALRVDIPHPTLGSVPTVASPLRLSKTPVRYRHAAPALGAHTESVLSTLTTNLETPLT